MSVFRNSFVGRLIYHASKHRFPSYPEEKPDYVLPAKYAADDKPPACQLTEENSFNSLDDVEKQEGRARSIGSNGAPIFVDYDGPNDPENPYNWPLYKKVLFIAGIGFLTISVYMGSAIYTPGIENLMNDLQITRVKATLPLTMFVIGYGLGPMVFSPMSENAVFGRTSIYIVTVFTFFILQIAQCFGPATRSIASMTVIRFLSGVFASPALGTGGASASDVVTAPYMPVGIIAWSIAAVCGPTLGPLVGAALVNGTGGSWLWTFRFMMIMSGASFVIFGFFLPESLGAAILRRKAQRLRKLTGNDNIVAEGEYANRSLTVRQVAVQTLWRPIEITLFEPVILFINLYIALIYSLIYLWFEAFPIVYVGTYHFTVVELGVSYVSVTLGIFIGSAIYIGYIYFAYTKKLLQGRENEVVPEVFLPPAIVGSVVMPIGIAIFGWSASPNTHWIGSLIGAMVFGMGGFVVIQSLFNYMAMSFPRYIASVFGGNALFRSVMAGCFPLFGPPLYNNLKIKDYPVGLGSTIVVAICLCMIAIPVVFYILGSRIRATSRYAGS
ncbi:LAMI_0F00122g1_1 [Lachancea mirantina]|uniref:LAMI_0F00122g1_1 n=1 Tax=Lachancea mirantina TaxID=1230905 RepID=A0A1G4JV68_9SACH|nr:LAMI_0F00122g1_1 [Lachancea mirantina]